MSLQRRLRDLRLRWAKLPSLRSSVPEAPQIAVRDPWPGDAVRGAKLMRGEFVWAGVSRKAAGAGWTGGAGGEILSAQLNGFSWLRDLRVIGDPEARVRTRALIEDWFEHAEAAPLAIRPDITGARITAWLAHFDFFAASADDEFRNALMGKIIADARVLAAALPAEERDGRALTALKGLIAASVALPEHADYLTRGLRFLPQEIGRQVLEDGGHIERSPAAHLAALRDLIEIRAMLQAGGAAVPGELGGAIDRMAAAMRTLCHGGGLLSLFNGSRDEPARSVDQVLAQAGRAVRSPQRLQRMGFERLAAGRSVLIMDTGVPAAPGCDRLAHAGTLSFELSVDRDRLIVNCGAAPPGHGAWADAARATAAHSTLVIADTSSSELKPGGLGRRPAKVAVERQEANGAHWLDVSHDGWRRVFGAVHRRRIYMSESGEDIRGEDVVDAPSGQPFAIRFHLHPSVIASVQQDGEGVLLRLTSGGWRLRAEGARLALEESIFLAGAEPRRAEQVVLSGDADGPQVVKWAITKVG